MARDQNPAGVSSHGHDRPEVDVTVGDLKLSGTMVRPAAGHGIVLFAHGSGSSRLSPRNRFVAECLQREGLGTLLFNLLRPQEAANPNNVFDIGLLADRLVVATEWVRSGDLEDAPVGYFGASTGVAAALVAETITRHRIAAVVSRGGRPDLAGDALRHVRAPTLLIVGGDDGEVIDLNERAFAHLTCEKELKIVPGAGHLFEEPGTLDQVVSLASAFFSRFLSQESPRHASR